MPATQKSIGEQLTALERTSPDARSRYEQRLQEVFEERLSAPIRVGCSVAGAICILFGAFIARAVFFDREAYNYWPNLMLGTVVTVTALIPGAALIAVAARGVYRRNYEGQWAASSGLAMLATWGMFMLLAAFGLPDDLRGLFLTLGLLCLGAAAYVAQQLSAARAQLALEKRLLELEQHLAEISERLERQTDA